MTAPPLFPLIEQWSPAQKLAAYDLCRLLSETLWQQYQDELLDEMIRQDQNNGFAPLDVDTEDQIELPFDDDPLAF